MYKSIASLEITCGEYAAKCDCCKTFRNTPEGVIPRALYDNKVRDPVLDLILKDGMDVEQTLKSLLREYFLDLSTGFVYDVLRDCAEQLDMSTHRRKVLDNFSGTLCVDELYLGRFTLLLATDPLSDLPVAFALVAANDQDHMGRFHKNLKTWGLNPQTVVTDGSNLYPSVLAELWPDAKHQLCVFHVIKDINKLILDAVRRLRTAMSRRGKGGRKKKRGRKGAKSKAGAARRGMTLKEKAHFVFKHRYLIVKRQENLTESERDDLILIQEYLPELAKLRRFADRIYWLFDTTKDLHQASCRRAAILHDPAFRTVPELVKAMDQLDDEKFPKLMAFLKTPIGQRVCTNNHVERTNRMVRFIGEGAVYDVHPRVRQVMKDLLERADLPDYLDMRSREMLLQARATARDSGLVRNPFIQDGPDVIWFTWTGSRNQRTLFALGQYFGGLKVADKAIALIFEKTTIAHVR